MSAHRGQLVHDCPAHAAARVALVQRQHGLVVERAVLRRIHHVPPRAQRRQQAPRPQHRLRTRAYHAPSTCLHMLAALFLSNNAYTSYTVTLPAPAGLICCSVPEDEQRSLPCQPRRYWHLPQPRWSLRRDLRVPASMQWMRLASELPLQSRQEWGQPQVHACMRTARK